ncbi:hypothetical protein KO516_06810 [Citreicella sp. C3M06]|uniref:hypothetical protein n=1 Tax=Citreicella sp. C3M06 TaxID=2841564 RepID=UPI001C08E5D2|nr:hypothetical protein [Citreicella sp. C3M06]MBU2960528.1 hypothetical protein [Citreicella sp. C3M06]
MNRLQISRMARRLTRTEGSPDAALNEANRVIAEEDARGRTQKADTWRAIRDALHGRDAPAAEEGS